MHKDHCRRGRLLQAVGYYRLTGYLYPFRESEPSVNDEGRTRSRVLNRYRVGTTVENAVALLDFRINPAETPH